MVSQTIVEQLILDILCFKASITLHLVYCNYIIPQEKNSAMLFVKILSKLSTTRRHSLPVIFRKNKMLIHQKNFKHHRYNSTRFFKKFQIIIVLRKNYLVLTFFLF